MANRVKANFWIVLDKNTAAKDFVGTAKRASKVILHLQVKIFGQLDVFWGVDVSCCFDG